MRAKSSRRKFIGTAGVALSAPIAAAAANLPALVPASGRDDTIEARLAMLEDLAAIRMLNERFARHVKDRKRDALAALFADPSAAAIARGLVAVTTDHAGEQDAIEVAPDRATATARVHRVVDMEHAIEPSCPLVEMARQQGGGFVRRTERSVFEHVYVRQDGVWKIQYVTYRRA